MSTPDTSCNEPCAVKLNSIEWNELSAPDPAAAMAFYGDLFGWTTEKFESPGMEYSMWKTGDRIFGGVMKTQQPGSPAYWLNYVSVADVAASLAKATSLGATVCLPTTDLGGAGIIAILQDPQGAMIGLHQQPGAK